MSFRAARVEIRASLTGIQKLAANAAKRSDHRCFFVGAIALRGGAIVGVGYNKGTKHAEVKAIQNIWPNKRRGVVLHVVRVTRSGTLSNSLPCKSCQRYLLKSGIKIVNYTSQNGTFERLNLTQNHEGG